MSDVAEATETQSTELAAVCGRNEGSQRVAGMAEQQAMADAVQHLTQKFGKLGG